MNIDVAALKRTTQEAAARKYQRVRDELCTLAQQQIQEASADGNWECLVTVSDKIIAAVGMVSAGQILQEYLPPELDVRPGFACFLISWANLKDAPSMEQSARTNQAE